MKKVLLAAAITLVLALSTAGPASAAQIEEQHPGQPVVAHIEVCVNQSNAAAAKALFPTARLHIIPDDPDPELNGWVVIVGFGDKHPHSDAEEIAIRMRQRNKGMRGE